MINDLQVAIECWADTMLIEALVPTNRGYSHFSSCFHVEAAMVNGKLKDGFAIGIIDNDKNTIKYLLEFREYRNIDDSLKLWVHPDKHHYFIQFSPAIEKWILKVCTIGNINLEDFGLSNNLNELRKYTKHRTSKNESLLKPLFRTLTDRNDIEEVRLLKAWLSELKAKNYQIDKEALRNV